MKADLNIIGKILISGEFHNLAISIDSGRIAKIAKPANLPKAEETIKCKREIVLPGLIDVHVHLRDQNLSYKETFQSGTEAAAYGGFTTIIDMPNNNPLTDTPKRLKERMESAEGKININVGFLAAPPQNDRIREMLKIGCLGFKLYMAKQIGGINPKNDDEIEELISRISEAGGILAVHAEDPYVTYEEEKCKEMKNRKMQLRCLLKAHSPQTEAKGVSKIISIAFKIRNAKVHFCHISTIEALNMIQANKTLKRISCEVTPHHLFLNDSIFQTFGSLAYCVPPIREEKIRKTLVNGLINGSIDAIASDHAPHTIEEKQNSPPSPGLPGLETTLPIVLKNIFDGILPLNVIEKNLGENPAKIYGLHGRGKIGVGYWADLVIVDPTIVWKINPHDFKSKAKYSPFRDMEVRGKVKYVFLAGRPIIEEGELKESGKGRIIKPT